MSEVEFTRLLSDLRRGDEEAVGRLYALVYDELRRVAHNRLDRQVAGETMRTTELVHEAYLKFANAVETDVRDRAHFFKLAARAMRQILTDRARARGAVKRGQEPIRLDVDPSDLAIEARATELVALDEALSALEELEPRQTRVAELRFFVGLSVEETADTLKLSPRTVKRDWALARMFLIREMQAATGH